MFAALLAQGDAAATEHQAMESPARTGTAGDEGRTFSTFSCLRAASSSSSASSAVSVGQSPKASLEMQRAPEQRC